MTTPKRKFVSLRNYITSRLEVLHPNNSIYTSVNMGYELIIVLEMGLLPRYVKRYIEMNPELKDDLLEEFEAFKATEYNGCIEMKNLFIDLIDCLVYIPNQSLEQNKKLEE